MHMTISDDLIREQEEIFQRLGFYDPPFNVPLLTFPKALLLELNKLTGEAAKDGDVIWVDVDVKFDNKQLHLRLLYDYDPKLIYGVLRKEINLEGISARTTGRDYWFQFENQDKPATATEIYTFLTSTDKITVAKIISEHKPARFAKSKSLIILLLLSLSMLCKGQTTEEFTNQNATQIKYSLLNIAKLQLYLSWVKKGINIVDKGLTLIGDIKDGDLNLHTLFFDSHKRVSPEVKKYFRIAEIIRMQAGIVSNYKKALNQFDDFETFNEDEIKYLHKVMDNLIDLLAADIGNLTTILTDGKFEMTDDERVKNIDALYAAVSEKYNFFSGFTNDVKAYGSQRKSELHDLNTIKNLTIP